MYLEFHHTSQIPWRRIGRSHMRYSTDHTLLCMQHLVVTGHVCCLGVKSKQMNILICLSRFDNSIIVIEWDRITLLKLYICVKECLSQLYSKTMYPPSIHPRHWFEPDIHQHLPNRHGQASSLCYHKKSNVKNNSTHCTTKKYNSINLSIREKYVSYIKNPSEYT